MIPIVDLKKQYLKIKPEIMKAVEHVLDSCQFILGDEVKKLEEEIARYAGRKYAIAVANGTDAILLSLKAYGIKEGDSVITCAYTYYATAGAIARCGARPVFCEMDPATYNISPQALANLLKSQGPRFAFKAIVPVHLYGQMADMDEIMAIAGKYNLKVIEDAAQAFGASYKGKRAGAVGDAGCYSFYPGKNLGAYGDAGMIVTDDKELAEMLRVWRNQGNKIRYEHTVLGHNSRMDAVQGAVLRVKLEYIEKWNKKRQSIAAFYNKNLKPLGITTPFVSKEKFHTYHLYVIRFKERDQKEFVEKFLNSNGVDARTYYHIPLHLQECFAYLGYKKGDFPEAEKASGQTLAIPMYPELTEEEQEFVVKMIKEGIKRHRAEGMAHRARKEK